MWLYGHLSQLEALLRGLCGRAGTKTAGSLWKSVNLPLRMAAATGATPTAPSASPSTGTSSLVAAIRAAAAASGAEGAGGGPGSPVVSVVASPGQADSAVSKDGGSVGVTSPTAVGALGGIGALVAALGSPSLQHSGDAADAVTAVDPEQVSSPIRAGDGSGASAPARPGTATKGVCLQGRGGGRLGGFFAQDPPDPGSLVAGSQARVPFAWANASKCIAPAPPPPPVDKHASWLSTLWQRSLRFAIHCTLLGLLHYLRACAVAVKSSPPGMVLDGDVEVVPVVPFEAIHRPDGPSLSVSEHAAAVLHMMCLRGGGLTSLRAAVVLARTYQLACPLPSSLEGGRLFRSACIAMPPPPNCCD